MKYRARIYTLGCKVNQYESEAIAEELEKRGFEILMDNEGIADICIINTCTVTGESDRKSRQIIRRAIGANPGCRVIVTGCYAQVNGEKIAEIDGVNFVCGNKNKLIAVDKAAELAKEGRKVPQCCVESLDGAEFEDMYTERSERTRAYIKIEDGCENKCAYCIIPRARGKVRSKSPDKVIEEAKMLNKAGYHELVLTGIEVTAYGKDKNDGVDIGELMLMLDRETEFERISLGSLEPSMMRKSFVDKIASMRSASHHFHLSLQSGCDRTLAGMKRKYNTETVRKNVEYIRTMIPDAAFTADIIVGFPGESDEDFEATCQFVRELGLLDAHVFAYSKREGTVAAAMKEQVDERTKSKRSAVLIGICKEKKAELVSEMAKRGGIHPVLFETFENGILTGRMNNYAVVEADFSRDLSGMICMVEITGHKNAEVLLGKIHS